MASILPASTPTSTIPSKYYGSMDRISQLIDQLVGLDQAPSDIIRSGPNVGRRLSDLPPSVTPFRQRGNVRRVSKVSAETARARQQREQRPARAPKPPALLARAEPAPAKPTRAPSFRVAPSSPLPRGVGGGRKPAQIPQLLNDYPESERRRVIGPSALSQALGRIEAQPPVSSIFRATPGPSAADYARAQEDIDIANTQRAFDTGYARMSRQLADEDIARTQAGYRAGDEAFRNRMRELDAEAYARHMAALRAGRRANTAVGRARSAANSMEAAANRTGLLDPLIPLFFD